MMGIEIIILVGLLLVAPFIALQAYLLVWMLGPAIRRAGRRWAEGWFEVAERRGAPRVRVTPPCAEGTADLGAVRHDPDWTGEGPGPLQRPAPATKYTITGKPIR